MNQSPFALDGENSYYLTRSKLLHISRQLLDETADEKVIKTVRSAGEKVCRELSGSIFSCSLLNHSIRRDQSKRGQYESQQKMKLKGPLDTEVEVDSEHILFVSDLLDLNEDIVTGLWANCLLPSTRETLEEELNLSIGFLTGGCQLTVTACILLFFFQRKCLIESLKIMLNMAVYQAEGEKIEEVVKQLVEVLKINKQHASSLSSGTFEYAGKKPFSSPEEGKQVIAVVESHFEAERKLISEAIFVGVTQNTQMNLKSIAMDILDALKLELKESSPEISGICSNLLFGLLSLFDVEPDDQLSVNSWKDLEKDNGLDTLQKELDEITHDGCKGVLNMAVGALLLNLGQDFDMISTFFDTAFSLRTLGFLRLGIFRSSKIDENVMLVQKVSSVHTLLGRYMIYFLTTADSEEYAESRLSAQNETGRDSLFDLTLLEAQLVKLEPLLKQSYFFLEQNSADGAIVYKEFLERLLSQVTPTHEPKSLFMGCLSLLSALTCGAEASICQAEVFGFVFNEENNSAISWVFFSKLVTHHVGKLVSQSMNVQNQTQYGSIESRDQLVIAEFLSLINGICGDLELAKKILTLKVGELNMMLTEVLVTLMQRQIESLILTPALNFQLLKYFSTVVTTLVNGGSRNDIDDADKLINGICLPLVSLLCDRKVCEPQCLVEFIRMVGIFVAHSNQGLSSELVEFLVHKVLMNVKFLKSDVVVGSECIRVLGLSLKCYKKDSSEFIRDLNTIQTSGRNVTTANLSGNFSLMVYFLQNTELFHRLAFSTFLELSQNSADDADGDILSSWFSAFSDTEAFSFISASGGDFPKLKTSNSGYGYGLISLGKDRKLKKGYNSEEGTDVLYKLAQVLEMPVLECLLGVKPALELGNKEVETVYTEIARHSLEIWMALLNQEEWFLKEIQSIRLGDGWGSSPFYNAVQRMNTVVSGFLDKRLIQGANVSFLPALVSLWAASNDPATRTLILGFLKSLSHSEHKEAVIKMMNLTEFGRISLSNGSTQTHRDPGFYSVAFASLLKKTVSEDSENLKAIMKFLLKEDNFSLELRKVLCSSVIVLRFVTDILYSNLSALNTSLTGSSPSTSNAVKLDISLADCLYQVLIAVFPWDTFGREHFPHFWLYHFESAFLFLQNSKESVTSSSVIGSIIEGLAKEAATSEDGIEEYAKKSLGIDSTNESVTLVEVSQHVLDSNPSGSDLRYFSKCLFCFVEKILVVTTSKAINQKLMIPRSELLILILGFMNKMENDTSNSLEDLCSTVALVSSAVCRTKNENMESLQLGLICTLMSRFVANVGSFVTDDKVLQCLLASLIHFSNKTLQAKASAESCFSGFAQNDFAAESVLSLLGEADVALPTKIFALTWLGCVSNMLTEFEFDRSSDIISSLTARSVLQILLTDFYEAAFQEKHKDDDIVLAYSSTIINFLIRIAKFEQGAKTLAGSDFLTPFQTKQLPFSRDASIMHPNLKQALQLLNTMLKTLQPLAFKSVFSFSSTSRTTDADSIFVKCVHSAFSMIRCQRQLIFQPFRTKEADSSLSKDMTSLLQVLNYCFEIVSDGMRIFQSVFGDLGEDLDSFVRSSLHGAANRLKSASPTLDDIAMIEVCLWYLIRREAFLFSERKKQEGEVKNELRSYSDSAILIFSAYGSFKATQAQKIMPSLQGALSIIGIQVKELEQCNVEKRGANLPVSTRRLFEQLQASPAKDSVLKDSIKVLAGILSDWSV